MVRLILLMSIGMLLAGCVSSEMLKDMAAKRKARIEAAKIPAVNLSDRQIAKLKELAPKASIAWLRAGRQSDGRIFVCHVIEGKNLLGTRYVHVLTGTFEADGSYQRSPAYLWSVQAVVEDCRAHGFDPPVTIHTSYSVIRVR